MSTRHRYTIGPLFGEVAEELGLVEEQDLLDAICQQEEARSRGGRAGRIGQILVQRGVLSREAVERIMAEVERRAMTLEIPGYHSLELVSRDDFTLRFRGLAASSRRPVMLKILRFRLSESPEQIERFRRETRALARLAHPNLVRLLDADELEGIPYLVLEHVLGPDLRNHLEDNGPRPEHEALEIAISVASGLAHAHSRGILHGALRPAAILIPRLGGPKVTDFSIFDPSAPADRDFRPSNAPFYLAPEQAGREGWPTPRSDIYSLGATLYHMLTGRPPFRGPWREILRQLLRRPAPDPRILAPHLSPSVSEFVLSLIEKEPDRRPASMEAVIQQARILGSAVPAERHSPPPHTDHPDGPARLRSRR